MKDRQHIDMVLQINFIQGENLKLEGYAASTASLLIGKLSLRFHVGTWLVGYG